ncbi:peptidase [Dipodfec virus UA06Rod_12]|uniref:Peptidase n=1 Tax=Dipodfec virus UA06Rod_12 TaxID=2929316 RepID=A0A976N1T3_9VIRU|nr:peptidase [Dipodfec virus UA06Rod_12]
MSYSSIEDYLHSDLNKRWKYFKFSDMLFSETAFKLHINNAIPPEYVDNAVFQLDCLNELRTFFPHAITITSGYRCPKLNIAVGGVKNSKHLTASAVDIVLSRSNLNTNVKRHSICYYLVNSEIPFNKIIFEPSWLHIEFSKDNKRIIIGR